MVFIGFPSRSMPVSTTSTPPRLDLGAQLLLLTGPCSGQEVDALGGLFGRCLDAWETIDAFDDLLRHLPRALLSTTAPAGHGVRDRVAQLLVVYGGREEKRRSRLAALADRGVSGRFRGVLKDKPWFFNGFCVFSNDFP